MLNKDALQQLKDLKKTIIDSKEYGEGTVKGTQRRFGFVVLDDGREIFLSQDEMDKVFPDDRIRVEIVNEEKGKPTAVIQKVLKSALSEFTGYYAVKGKGHFVEPDLPRCKRWIFIPPSSRKGAKDGDYVRCKVTKQPFPHGKPQAQIITVIGDDQLAGIEADYIINKFNLDGPWPTDWQQQLQTSDNLERRDLTAMPLLTIDAASSRDLDDAVYAEQQENGWQLTVAVADPTALIAPQSALEKEASRRANSVYLPGQTVPMLPPELATDRCSLLPDQHRPALVCQLQIDRQGNISAYELFAATVSSKAKLSYQEVAALLSSSSESDHPYAEQLNTLREVSTSLLEQRRRDHLVIDGRPEYRLNLNAQRKIESIELSEKNIAHTLIEECMVAANRCAADYLSETGLFITHAGFRSERLADVNKLAEEQLSLKDLAPETPAGYCLLMKSIEPGQPEIPLRSVLSRLLERSKLSNQARPHFGMGLPVYTTFTSPIRKYSDLLVHRLIKQKLQGEAIKAPGEKQLETLQSHLDNSRLARQQMEQWLKCQYLAGSVGEVKSGIIAQINSNGFSVRLDENGIEGFVEAKQLPEKFSYDPMRMRLSSKAGQRYELEQAVTIKVADVNCRQRTIRFEVTTPADINAG